MVSPCLVLGRCGQDERCPVEPAPRFVVTGMAVTAHEQMRPMATLACRGAKRRC
jgi:hypothetical protein